MRIDDVATEATGPYWKPVYNQLEATGIRPIVGNAAHLTVASSIAVAATARRRPLCDGERQA